MQCEKSQRKHIIFELAEADVGQHISRLRPVVRLINALGARVAGTQAGPRVRPACVTATRAPSALIKRTTGRNRLMC